MKTNGGEASREYRAGKPSTEAAAQGYGNLAEMNDAIDTLPPGADDQRVKTVMRSIHASEALSDAEKRMGPPDCPPSRR